MDKILEALFELLPFSTWLEQIGVEKELAAGLAVLVTAVLLYYFSTLVRKVQAYLRDKKAARDLSPYFSPQEVKRATEFFIETQGQNNSPTLEEEIDLSSRFIVKKKLIAWFIRHAFDEKKDSDKFYLVLADSGMGKTTFLINLYIRYMSRWHKKYRIKLLPFRHKDILEHLRELAKNRDEAKNTILLLDAFDEYKGLLPPETPDNLNDDERFRKRLDEIVELTQDFREVVITSRTQYFPGQEDKPYELKIPRYYDKGFHTLAKLYLSPFDNDEIRRYLNKKYGRLKFWNWQKKRIAEHIVKTSPRLMVRPMLLSYIDYLVEGHQQYETTAQIYETLIDKWLEREADKRKHESTTRKKFIHDLYEFSRRIALLIYENYRSQNTLSVDKETARKLCETEGLDLRDYEITGQSLLTRDANHNWKFAHKSILEFFLAKEARENITLRRELYQSRFAGMDMAKLFCKEMGVIADMVFVRGGTFDMGCTNEQRDCGSDEKPVTCVTVRDFYIGQYAVTFEEYDAFCAATGRRKPSDWGWGRGRRPVIEVSWYDAVEYCNWLSEREGLRPVYRIDRQRKDPNNQDRFDALKWTVTLDASANGYRLPTEAEWEYAARGGHQSKGYLYSGSNDVDEVAWYDGNSGGKTHPVGQKKANELGLYDMSGNVWEWCWDWYGVYPGGSQVDYRGPGSGSGRVGRGGSWLSDARYCRVSNRYGWAPSYRDNYLGFRLVLQLPR